MGKDGLREWARRRAGVGAPSGLVSSSGAPMRAAPREEVVVVVPGVGIVAPAPARAGIAPLHQSESRAVETVVISKPDPTSPDRYAELLARTPDLMPGPAKADALKMTARGLEGAEYANWSPNTPYYTKVSDSTAEGDFGDLRRRRDRELAGS